MNIITLKSTINSHEPGQRYQSHVQYRRTTFLSKIFIYQTRETWCKPLDTTRQFQKISKIVSYKRLMTMLYVKQIYYMIYIVLHYTNITVESTHIDGGHRQLNI